MYPRTQHGALKASRGFSLLELLVVVAIIVVVTGLSLPSMMGAYHRYKLRSAGTDFSGLVQMARMRAVQDDRFYSIWPSAANGLSQQFVDIYPQGTNGYSGYGTGAMDARDPVIMVANEVVQQPQTAAPNTANLSTQLLGANPNGLAPQDGNNAASRITFGPQGLPCTPNNPLLGGGTVCNTGGGPVAYWVFFQDSFTQEWEAITITPAGRIQKWYYDVTAGAWGKL